MRQRGFTLIELLVVLVIIGLTLGLVTMNAAPSQRQAMQQEAQVGEPLTRHVGASKHHLRRVVAAHGVEGDGQSHGRGPLRRRRCPKPARSPRDRCNGHTLDRCGGRA